MKLAFLLFLLVIPAAITQNVDSENECSTMHYHLMQLRGALNRLCDITCTGIPTPAVSPPEDSCPVEWESLTLVRLGTINMLSTSTQSFTIPASVPTTAKEVLVYVYVSKGHSTSRFAQMKIYTEASSTRQFVKYLPIQTYPQNAISTVSENMWFPLTTNRRIYISLSATLTGSNLVGYVNIIGYR